MITVSVWNPAGSSPGHSALFLSALPDAGELTMSWWPVDAGSDTFLLDEAATLPYELEQRTDGRLPDARYRLYSLEDCANGVAGARERIGLDQAAMRTWWEARSLDGSYRLTDRNGCTSVLACLEAGGCRSYVELAGLQWAEPEAFLITPTRVREVCRAIIEGMTLSRT